MSSQHYKITPAPTPLVAAGHVQLVLLHDDTSYFYLEIPIDRIQLLCLKPVKYLIFLGWCVLGAEGVLRRNNVEIGTDGDLEPEGIYYYITGDAFDIARAVDPEVIKQRSNIPSESTGSRPYFRRPVLERDGYCIFSGYATDDCQAMHIIPYARGSEWLQFIIENRPHYDEVVEDFTDIDDVRNGALAWIAIHHQFDMRKLVILKTPNHVLKPADIPQCPERKIRPNSAYPDHERFTLQQLPATQEQEYIPTIPYNADAAFMTNSSARKPSGLLLHYNYGAAVVKLWGHGAVVLETDRERPKRAPSGISEHAMGPERNIHDRTIVAAKLETARSQPSGHGMGSTYGKTRAVVVDSKGKDLWDEDDTMLFFWGNSKAALERHRKRQTEKNQIMEQWRQAVH